MGYGGRTIELLQQYFEGKFQNLQESEDAEEDDVDIKGVDEEVSFLLHLVSKL